MPNASITAVNVDPILTEISVAYALEENMYAHSRVFPVLPIDSLTAGYFEFSRADYLRVATQVRTPGSAFAHKDVELIPRDLSLTQYGLEVSLPDEIRASRDSPIEDATKIEQLTQDMLLKRELDFFADYCSTATNPWQNPVIDVATLGAGRQWHLNTATIFEDIERWKRIIKRATGRKANKLVMADDIWEKVKNNLVVLGRIADNQTKQATLDFVAQIMELDEIIVTEAVYNSADEGQTFQGTDVLSNTMLLVYATDAPARLTPTAGYTVVWSEFDNVRAGGGAAITRVREERVKTDVFQGEMFYQNALIDGFAGMIISNVVDLAA